MSVGLRVLIVGIFIGLLPQIKIEAQIEQGINTDTAVVLNGRVKLVLPSVPYRKIQRRELFKQYTAEFRVDKLQFATGFDFGENTTYRLFCTNMDGQEGNDRGLTMWKRLKLFTDRIPHGRWIKSGYRSTKDGYLYFVNIVYPIKDGLRFAKFIFFDVDGKLAFGLFQCGNNEISRWSSYCDMDWRQMTPSSDDRSRFIAF